MGNFSENTPRAWKTFQVRANEAKRLNQWSDADAKSQVKIALTGDAASLVQDIDVGEDPDVRVHGFPLPGAKTYFAYMAELHDRFVPLMESKIALARFPKLRQEPGETLSDWHVRCKDEFMVAEPHADPETSPVLRRQFCHNILDIHVSTYVIDQDPQFYRDCLRVAQNKQGNMMQVRLAARNRASGGRLSAITGMVEEEEDNRVGAINYPIGTDTPTTTEANRMLRRGATQKGGAPQQGTNSMNRRLRPTTTSRSCYLCQDPTHIVAQCPYLKYPARTQITLPRGGGNKENKKPAGTKRSGQKGKSGTGQVRRRPGAKGPFRISAMGTEIEGKEVLGLCDPLEEDYVVNTAWINDEHYGLESESEEGN